MKHHILVVDDESSIRSSLKMILQHAGFRFSEAATGQEGLDRIAADEPDVAILDVKMPGMDGMEVLEALKRQGRDLPVIVISGHGDIDTAVRAVKLGAFNFVEKPFGEERVLVEIRNALEQRRLRQRAETIELEYDRQFEIVGSSGTMQGLRLLIQKAAPTQATILITGESGTGKELVARAIHRNSDRRDGPFIRVNCAAIPEELIESELFGHERGSFTGATTRQIGKFLQADHGTIFLDEIGDMSARTQAKVLRALETGEIEPVGAAKVITVDVRVIAATNKDLLDEIGKGAFREDLYFRLRVLPIECPPLRARPQDIPELVERFAAGTLHRFTPQALEALSRLPWKGNVRELRNIVERLLIMAPREQITAEDLPSELRPTRGVDTSPPTPAGADPSSRPAGSLSTRAAALASSRVSLKDFKEATEKEFLLAMLERNDWNISQTAKEIDTPRSNLYKKLEQYGISKDRVQQEE